MDAVRRLHAVLERDHGFSHFGVIHRTNIEVEILECLGRHVGRLGHARSRPAQHNPTGFIDAVVQDRAQGFVVERETVAGDVRAFAGVGAATYGDVGLNALHAEHFQVPGKLGMITGSVTQQFASDAGMPGFDNSDGPNRANGADQLHRELIRHINHVQQNSFALLEFGRVTHQQLAQLRKAWIGHTWKQSIINPATWANANSVLTSGNGQRTIEMGQTDDFGYRPMGTMFLTLWSEEITSLAVDMPLLFPLAGKNVDVLAG